MGEDEYRRRLLTFRAMTLLPSSRWPVLPYKLNGLSQVELARRNGHFAGWIHEQGIVTGLDDYDCHIASLNGIELSNFRDLLRKHILMGDYEEIRKLIVNTNRQNYSV